jgi:hypothetical protein
MSTVAEAPAPERPSRAATWLAALAPVLLGTIGSAWADLRVGFNCADHFSCGDLTCPPCATSLHWVLAGFIGEWILVATVTALFVAGRRHATRRRATTLARAALLPVAIIWYIATTAAATSWLT